MFLIKLVRQTSRGFDIAGNLFVEAIGRDLDHNLPLA
jgi:hypothetical protein